MQDIERIARELNQTLSTIRSDVVRVQFTQSLMEKLLKELVVMAASNQYPDYASAEQAYMSISSVANSVVNKGNSNIATAVNSRMSRLLKMLRDDEQYNRGAFQTELLALKAAVGG